MLLGFLELSLISVLKRHLPKCRKCPSGYCFVSLISLHCLYPFHQFAVIFFYSNYFISATPIHLHYLSIFKCICIKTHFVGHPLSSWPLEMFYQLFLLDLWNFRQIFSYPYAVCVCSGYAMLLFSPGMLLWNDSVCCLSSLHLTSYLTTLNKYFFSHS